MFGIGAGELLLLFVIALVVLGPERLPSLARDVGKVMNDLRRTSDELRSEFLRADEIRPRSVNPPTTQAEPAPVAEPGVETQAAADGQSQRETPGTSSALADAEPSGEEPTAFDQEAQRRADEAATRPERTSGWTPPADRPEPDRWG